MRHRRYEITVQLSLSEVRLLCRALGSAADKGLIDEKYAMQRIGELTAATWKAEDGALDLSEKIREGTLKGLEKQRQSGNAGPTGFLGPGRPRIKIDAVKAQMLRDQGLSQLEVAKQLGVSKSTLWRHFKKKLLTPPA